MFQSPKLGVYYPLNLVTRIFNMCLLIHGLEYFLWSVTFSVFFRGHLSTATVLPLKMIFDQVASQFDVLDFFVIPKLLKIGKKNYQPEMLNLFGCKAMSSLSS